MFVFAFKFGMKIHNAMLDDRVYLVYDYNLYFNIKRITKIIFGR